MTTTQPRSRAQIALRLEQSVGRLSTTALQRMEREMPWFREQIYATMSRRES